MATPVSETWVGGVVLSAKFWSP